LTLKRIMPKPYLDAVKGLFDCLPAVRIKRAVPHKGGRVMCMFGLFDAHFGKLCWGEECGADSDLKIQEVVYANAVEDVINRIAHLNPELIYWPIGNDFVHIDNDRNETTKGTRVATDSRHGKIIRTAFRAQVLGMQMAAQVCPVEGFLVGGNHDRNGNQYLGLALDARFHDSTSVKIDLGPASRKYRRYGETNLGFVHGDKIKASDLNTLAGIMMNEQRQELAGTLYSEWFTGHNHRSQRYEDTKQGTVVRSLQSLSATDDYLFDNGWSGARRAAEVYVYEPEGGYCGHWLATART
jgi:hypothetical protein